MTWPQFPGGIPTLRMVLGTPDTIDQPNVFPLLPGQSFVQAKGPVFSTSMATSRSGRRVAIRNSSSPIWAFKVMYEVIRDRPPSLSEVQKLRAFFMSQYGQASNWYYFDPFDNLVSNQILAPGDGVTTAFQLTRTVNQNGVQTFTEPVYALTGPPVITINGRATTAFTVSQPGGVVTFTTAPAAGAIIMWSGAFMFWCHFVKDDLTMAQDYRDMWSLDGLEFESQKP
jgi:uncharacterized protein (TIGR02217 family)